MPLGFYSAVMLGRVLKVLRWARLPLDVRMHWHAILQRSIWIPTVLQKIALKKVAVLTPTTLSN
jgi:hypothetical protein